MKLKRLPNLRRAGLLALGVFLAHGAQADTVLDFEAIPPGATINAAPGMDQWMGDYAAASSPGVTVSGFGTPNVGLTWAASPVRSTETRWDFYHDGSFWNVAQLNDSVVGVTHRLTFTPNNPAAAVVIKSFNFFPYYNSTEHYAYDVTVVSGLTVVSGPIHVTFKADATSAHPVSINYTGAPGQTLKLNITRVAAQLGAGDVEGGEYNLAVDDIRFAQTPETAFPAGPQVVSVAPADGQSGVAAVLHPYSASITNGDTTLVPGSIRLKLDGTLVSPAPAISSSGGVTNVDQAGLEMLSSGSHLYTLTYDDNLGGHYTNETAFSSIYTVLPSAYALPPGSGLTNGFTYRTVSASTEATNTLASTLARARAQLTGTLINPDSGLPFTNSATLGPNPDGSFNIDTVLNFNDNGTGAGNFPNDLPFPGLDSGLLSDSFSTEAWLYLDLPAGYHRFGVNSDDGFEVSVLPPQGVPGAPVVPALYDNGRAAADTLFDCLVQTSGVYPFRLIYFESALSASCEFFSVTNLAAGGKALVNDLATPGAVKSYRVLKPRITRIARTGSDVVIDWAYGSPPWQVQFKGNFADAWADVGTQTSSRTAQLPMQPGGGFLRVIGK